MVVKINLILLHFNPMVWGMNGLIFLTQTPHGLGHEWPNFPDTNTTYLEPQKLVTFGFQLCPINHKNCRGSLNLVLTILGDTYTHNFFFMGKHLSPHSETIK